MVDEIRLDMRGTKRNRLFVGTTVDFAPGVAGQLHLTNPADGVTSIGLRALDVSADGSLKLATIPTPTLTDGQVWYEASGFQFRQNGVTQTLNDASVIDHNALLNYITNQHIDHSSVNLSVAGTSDQVSVSAGDGDITASRSWTIGLSDNPVVPGNARLGLPVGTTAQRPGVPQQGDLRVNTDLATTEIFRGSSWVDLEATGGGEANTASSAGTGVSLFYQKVGVDLEFNAIKSENSILGVALDAITHDIELTVNQAQIDHDQLTNYVANQHIDHSAVVLTVSGTANEVDVSAGSGDITASRTWTVGISDDPIMPGTSRVRIPAGTTAQRPGTPGDGDLRVNSDLATTEIFRGGAWRDLESAGGGEANTASSAGTGVSLFYQKVGVDLEFNAIKSENSILSVALDAVSHDIELTVNQGQIDHDALSNYVANQHIDHSGVTLSISGTADEIDVSAGDGDLTASRSWTVGLTDNPVIPGNARLRLPVGTTAQRPVTPLEGDMRLNSDLNTTEVYQGGSWTDIGGSGTFTGTVGTNQVAYGTAVDVLGGSANLTFDGTTLAANTLSVVNGIAALNFQFSLTTDALSNTAEFYAPGTGQFDGNFINFYRAKTGLLANDDLGYLTWFGRDTSGNYQSAGGFGSSVDSVGATTVTSKWFLSLGGGLFDDITLSRSAFEFNTNNQDTDFIVGKNTAGNAIVYDAGLDQFTLDAEFNIQNFLNQAGISAPSVSPAGQGRIYFDSTSNTFKVSENGGAYVDLVGGGGGGIGGSGTVNAIPKFTAATTIGDSAITDNGSRVTISNRELSVTQGIGATQTLGINQTIGAGSSGLVVIGDGASIDGGSSRFNGVVIGRDASNNENDGVVIGQNAVANVWRNVLIGEDGISTGIRAVGIGQAVNVGHNDAVAIGRGAATSSTRQFVVGPSGGSSITQMQFGDGTHTVDIINPIEFNDSTASVSPSTGAVTVNGGIGVAGAVWAGEVIGTTVAAGPNFAFGAPIRAENANPDIGWVETGAGTDLGGWSMEANAGVWTFKTVADNGSTTATIMRVTRALSNVDTIEIGAFADDDIQLKGDVAIEASLNLRVLTDATRGAAGNTGRIIFNSDDGQLNIDDGTNWTLPDGTPT